MLKFSVKESTGKKDQVSFKFKDYNNFLKMRKLVAEQYHIMNVKEIPGNVSAVSLHGRNLIQMAKKSFKKESSDQKTYTITYKNRIFKDEISTGFTIKKGENPVAKFKECKEEILSTVRHQRNKLKTVNSQNKTYTCNDGFRLNYTLSGRCHVKNGEIIEMAGRLSAREVYKEKKPSKDHRYIGIELEFFCNKVKEDLGKMLFDAKLHKYVHLKSDGSIQISKSGYHAHELAILVKESEHESVVKKIIDVLSKTDATVNKSCGMHVHIDMRDRNRDLVFSNLVSAQPILYAMNPKSRLENNYCKKTKTKVFDSSMDRYHGINPNAYSKYGTIEVRIHSGTVDAEKINNWVKLLVTIANKSDEVKRASRTFKGFIKQYNIDETLSQYISNRMAKFAGETVTNRIEEAA